MTNEERAEKLLRELDDIEDSTGYQSTRYGVPLILAHDDEIKRECAEKAERLTEFAEEVVKWSEAYPVSIFHEPTPEQVDAVCKTLGFRIDCIAAMILRAFTKPWGDKARAAIMGKEVGND